MAHKGMILKKINHKACCDKPQCKYFSDYRDEDGRCKNCDKYLKDAWVEKKWVSNEKH